MPVGDLESDLDFGTESASESEADSPIGAVVDGEPDAGIRVDCYVRSCVPPAITGIIDGVVERLDALDDRDLIDDYRVERWPPECGPVGGSIDENASTRDELVAEFERWAARNGHSLEPAFRRREIPSSSFGVETAESGERVRVPIVALAVYEDDAAPEDAVEAEPADASLRGVVPYTERPDAERSRTYTVDDWLTLVETADSDVGPGPRRPEGLTPLEGRQ